MMHYRGIIPLQRVSRACIHFSFRSHASNDTNCCDGAPPLEPLVPPVPGTVKEHFHHILIKLNTPAINDASKGGDSWPSKVERHPTILKAFRSLASYRAAAGDDSGVKITAYDHLEETRITPATSSIKQAGSSEEDDDEEKEEESCDVFIFPAGVRYHALPVSLLDAVVYNGIDGQGDWNKRTHMRGGPAAAAAAAVLHALETRDMNAKKLYLFVCCHGSRDARCGVVGSALAKQLLSVIKVRQLEDLIEVYSTSHIGGHKYAGNVIVYGGSHPADGDWYGGLHAAHAEVFLDSLLTMEIGVDGGAEDPMLREYWRGRMGLSKEEQRALWQAAGGVENGAESEVEEGGEEEPIIRE